MGRPPLGPAKKSRRIPLNVTEAQYALIQAKGGTEWVRRTVVAALAPSRGTGLPPLVESAEDPAAPTSRPATPARRQAATARKTEPTEPEAPPHRHKRERVGPKFVGGVDIGEYRCADPTCRVTLGVLQ